MTVLSAKSPEEAAEAVSRILGTFDYGSQTSVSFDRFQILCGLAKQFTPYAWRGVRYLPEFLRDDYLAMFVGLVASTFVRPTPRRMVEALECLFLQIGEKRRILIENGMFCPAWDAYEDDLPDPRILTAAEKSRMNRASVASWRRRIGKEAP